MLRIFNAAGEEKVNEPGFAPQAVVFSAYYTGNPTVANGGTVVFDTKLFDPFGAYNPATGRFQPKIPGYYDVHFATRDNGASAAAWARSQLWKNDAQAITDGDFQANAPGESIGGTVVYLNGTTDYLTIRRYRGDGASGQLVGTAPEHNHFTAALVAASVGVAPEPWHVIGNPGEPAFGSGWSNHGMVCKFMKDPHGFVHMTGRVQYTGVGGPTMVTLPAGYRPADVVGFPLAGYNANRILLNVQLQVSGQVNIYSGADSSGTSFSYTHIDPITFRAEQ